MPQPSFKLGRRRLNPAVTEKKVDRLTKACWKSYPKAKVGLSVLSFGAHGVTRNKRRNDCIGAAKSGKGDPRGKDKKPAILSKYAQLWRISEPWAGRPFDSAGNVFRSVGLKTGGDALRSMAEGWKPPGPFRFRDLERKATILGGIQALQALGTAPWASFDLNDVPIPKLSGDNSTLPLMALVGKGAAAEGRQPPPGIKEAAEYIRQRVIAEKLEGVAWAGHGVVLATAALNAQNKRSQVEGGISAGTGLAAKGLYAAAAATGPTIIGPIILGAAGGIMDGISLGMTALSGRSKVEKTRSEGLANSFTLKFQQELDKRGVRLEKKALKVQISDLEAEAAEQAVFYTSIIKAGVWVGVLGGATGLTYVVIRALRRRAE